MAAVYLAKNYGSNKHLKWAIAGRRLKALEDLKAEMVQIDGNCTNVGVIIADSANMESLSSMIARTKVIITTAGAFDIFFIIRSQAST
jgi:short subunit dehydrogenase-like uncharacterized protein